MFNQVIRHYSIRKLSLGVASVLIGIGFVHANPVLADSQAATTPPIVKNKTQTQTASEQADNDVKNAAVTKVKANLNNNEEIDQDGAVLKKETIHYQEQGTGNTLAPDNIQRAVFVPIYKKSNITVEYYDETNKKFLKKDQINGYVGSNVRYDPKNNIKNYENNGYVLNKSKSHALKDETKYQDQAQSFLYVFDKVEQGTATIEYEVVDPNGDPVPSTGLQTSKTLTGNVGDKINYSTRKIYADILKDTHFSLKKDEFSGTVDISSPTTTRYFTKSPQTFLVEILWTPSKPVTPVTPGGGIPETPTPGMFLMKLAAADPSSSPNNYDDYNKDDATVLYSVVLGDEIVVSKAESPSYQFAKIDSPTITGYHLVNSSQATVSGVPISLQSNDAETTVFYAKNSNTADHNNPGTTTPSTPNQAPNNTTDQPNTVPDVTPDKPKTKPNKPGKGNKINKLKNKHKKHYQRRSTGKVRHQSPAVNGTRLYQTNLNQHQPNSVQKSSQAKNSLQKEQAVNNQAAGAGQQQTLPQTKGARNSSLLALGVLSLLGAAVLDFLPKRKRRE